MKIQLNEIREALLIITKKAQSRWVDIEPCDGGIFLHGIEIIKGHHRRIFIPGDGSLSRTVTIERDDFYTFIGKVYKLGGEIECTIEEDQLVVDHQKITARFGLVDGFDLVGYELTGQKITHEAGKFIDALEPCLVAASKDQSRFNLTGLFLDRGNLYATDGHRLVKREVFLGSFDESIILPKEAMEAVLYGLKKKKVEFFDITVTGNEFLIEIDTLTIKGKGIEGKYPEVGSIIRDEWPIDTKITVPAKELRQGLEIIKPFVDHTKAVEISREGDTLLIGCEDTTAKVSILGGEYSPGLMLNVDYLLDVAKDYGEAEIDLYFDDDKSPVRIKEGNKSGLWLVMPIRK